MSLLRSLWPRCSSRCISTTTRRLENWYSESGSYKGEGKTVVHVLNRDVADLLLIDSYSSHGFRINSGLFIIGPCAIFPRTIFHWDVSDHNNVPPEAMSLFALIEPKIDILLIGAGDKGNTIPYETRRYLQVMKINHEVLSTADACGEFNFLNSDNRNVACALIPPETVVLETDAQHIENLNLKRRLFSVEESSMEEVARLDEAMKERHYSRSLEEHIKMIKEKKKTHTQRIEEAVEKFTEKEAQKQLGRGNLGGLPDHSQDKDNKK